MNINKRLAWKFRYLKYPDEGGAVAGGTSSVGTGGDGGASVGTPSTPSDGGGGDIGGAAAPSTPSDPGSEWLNLGSTDDLDHVEIPPEPQTPEPKPVTEPKQPVPPQQPQPAPPPSPQAAAEGQPPTGAAERPLTASDPWRIADGLEAHRADVIAHLAATKFALSEDDIKALDADVTVAVPQLLSRVFLEGQMAMQRFLAQAVPGMIKQYNTVTTANDDAEKKFFSQHKALDANNPQHRAAVSRIATIYRQANPGIPLDQLIAEVGPMVMTALQINGAAQPRGSAPALPRGGMPFRPAVNGGGGAPIAPEPPNEWAGLGQQYD